MGYGDVIYDQPFNEYLSNRIDSVQHKAAWCISNHWSHIRIILKKKKHTSKLVWSIYIKGNGWDDYVDFIRFFISRSLNISVALFHSLELRQDNQIHSLLFIVGASIFKNSFLLYVVRDWNKLDPGRLRCLSYESFCNALLNFIRPSENKIFHIHDLVVIKLLTRLRLGLCHLREHTFWHNFEDT